MNEQLQQALSEIIVEATSGIDAAKDFVISQAPDVIQQLIIWKTTWYAIVFFLCLAVTIAITVVSVWLIRKTYRDGEDWGFVAFIAIASVSLPVIGVGVGVSGYNWLQITMAPKIWLLEYAANLVK